MVVIRLQRRGTKKTPHHRIVAADRRHAQRGRVLETLGYYDPSDDPPRFLLDEARLGYWVSTGAQMSEAVAALVRRFKRTQANAV
ncbi:MAG: 30S ribosomal protein S16 [Candidatus Omnitrophica bacterium]|nr:30S ribosomal protein S16 [Candidatus Omnitrophota bacterium]